MTDKLAHAPDYLPTPVEQLTAQFYDWEQRGRGWQVWPWPVDLEPPFRPFFLYDPGSIPTTLIDDARRPTLLSGLTEKLLGRGSRPPTEVPQAPEVIEIEAEEFWDDSPVLELQVGTPTGLKVTREAAERLLLTLPVSAWPVAFEIVGLPEATVVQLVARASEAPSLGRQLSSYFPDAALTESTGFLEKHWSASGEKTVLVDFGLSQEFMRPLRTFRDFAVDPLTGMIGALADLRQDELGMVQILFEPARHAWAENALRAVTDWEGKPFFLDAPEMVPLAREKIARPLFAAVLRIAARSASSTRVWEIVRGLGGALRQLANPPSNEFIPLSNDDYPEELHEEDLLLRRSHRSGMLLNSEELVSLVHLPAESVRAEKLLRLRQKTKAAPAVASGHRLVLGENAHTGRTTTVTLPPEIRLRHTHVVGATGTGKTHLLLQMIRQDVEQGEGLAVFDPHGDLIDRVLGYIPEERVGDVILLDPSDEAFPIGFNVLEARSELEKNLLASDLVAVFRRLSTSWGDQMHTVLANGILALLESERGGTLLDLRRFLVDPAFRRDYVPSVQDLEVVFFWEREYPLLKGQPQAPLLTRLDAFLRPKAIRAMVGQQSGHLDLAKALDEGKILLARLAHGAIGQENAYLLGSLLVAKLHQVALARQARPEGQRKPFYLYLDEFHHFATPSMAALLSGGRKFGVGLTLAHQDLRQLDRDNEVAAAVLANPATRLVFRVSETDARKLAEGFSFFGAEDLVNLSVGEAIGRIERADWDFNLKTLPLPPIDSEAARRCREEVSAHSRASYGIPRQEIEELLRRAYPASTLAKKEGLRETRRRKTVIGKTAPESVEELIAPEIQAQPPKREEAPPKDQPGRDRIAPRSPVAPSPLGRGGPQHIYLQNLIKRWADSRGWKVTIEKEILGGLGSTDVALEREGVTVACEITVASTPEQELGNVQKCLAGGFKYVVVASPEQKILNRARRAIFPNLEDAHRERVHFLTPEELFAFLEEREAETVSTEETIKGYKVRVRYKPVEPNEKELQKQAIGKVVLDAMKRLRKT